MPDPISNDELDDLIWKSLRDSDLHPFSNPGLTPLNLARPTTARIDSRIQAMRRAGRIRFHRGAEGRCAAHVRAHGWEVLGCPGEGYREDGQWDWREGCSDCLRRINPDPGAGKVEPPPIIAFWCELRIAPD